MKYSRGFRYCVLILCLCVSTRSVAQRHLYNPGILFLCFGNEPGQEAIPIAIIGEDSIYQPTMWDEESDKRNVFPKREKRYHRKDSIYVIAHDGKALAKFHVSNQDSSFWGPSAVDGEQIHVKWPRGVDSQTTPLGGSRHYFRNRARRSYPASPAERKTLLDTCERHIAVHGIHLADTGRFFLEWQKLMKLDDDSVERAFVSLGLSLKNNDTTSIWLFAILRRAGQAFIPELVEFDSGWNERFILGEAIDQFDIDGDGRDEVVVDEIGDEISCIAIFQHQATGWRRIYDYCYSWE